MITLRDYQNKAHDCIFREWENCVSTLVVLPTGTGKTVLFADVINTFQPKRALVIAHREELIWQARDKIFQVTGLECGVEMADNYVNGSLFGDLPVVISTVQTQNSNWGDRKRMGRFKPTDFGLLIIDECHHGTADSYRNVIHYYSQNPELKVLGVTATPDRADEEALGQIFQTVAFDYEILDAINDGWLVPIEQQFVEINGLDFSKMRTTAGDLNGADLAEVMEAERNLQGVAGATLEIVQKKRSIVFTASVKQAEALSDIFNRKNFGSSDWVCGATNKDKRREILQRFQDGKIQIVCNCGVLTEGFDNPGVEVVVMARPTKSRSLYAQMAGRSTRPLPNVVDHGFTEEDSPEFRKERIAASAKPSCLIVDFVGNSGRHKLMSSADILGGNVSDDVLEKSVNKAKKLGKPVRMAELIEDEHEREKQSKLAAQAKIEAALRKQNVVARVKYKTRNINPFDLFDLEPVSPRGWDYNKQLSEKQKALLLKQGIDPGEMPYAQAKQLLNEMFRRWGKKLCTLRQAEVLKRFGYETKDLTMDRARQLLDALAKNRWKRPSQEPKPEPDEDQVPF